MPLFHGDLEVTALDGFELYDADKGISSISDAVVDIFLLGNIILQAQIYNNYSRSDPMHRVSLAVCHVADHLSFQVWGSQLHNTDKPLGNGSLTLGSPDNSWLQEGPVLLEDGLSSINLRVKFMPAKLAVEGGMGVPKSYFPMRRGGVLTLYQDAHGHSLPGVGDADRSPSAEGAFDAIAKTLRRAKKFIYIIGWSIWTETRLERNRNETLGELLKQKAGEGVDVLVLLWNEKFTAMMFPAFVATHDSETESYFKGTGVHVALARRLKTHGCLGRQLFEALWSHHQKAIVSDDAENGIVSYLGGFDLTNGRWDTQKHELFRTLSKEHEGDFYNSFVTVPADKGPREPWHDVHSRITGLAAVDVLRNFEERWRKQAPGQADLLLQSSKDDLIVKTATKSKDIWQMQVLRSIDESSVIFNPNRTDTLDFLSGRLVDTSLHRGIVRLIRRAENFIYIENQFFIGSSFAWDEDQEVDARNMVPIEIAKRIEDKIRAGEGFRVYLLLPMIPEGNKDNHIIYSAMLGILRWEYLTLRMMYKRIATALQEVGSDKHPADYLVVLCLGKQESRKAISKASGLKSTWKESESWRWRQVSKFLIYVHSKLAIADDAHVIVGSANFNERSLSGTKDSEIAVSAQQVRLDDHGDESEVKDGVVSAFRRALWAEHTWGVSEEEADVLGDPGSLAAIRRIRELADEALDAFASGNPNKGHRVRFMRYPLHVSKDGEVSAMPNMTNAPHFDIPMTGGRFFYPDPIL